MPPPRPARRPGSLRRGPAATLPAARDGELGLDHAALIGVLQMEDRRAALVRLPDGSIRRVGPGDMLLGWRVALIGRDALRLERGGQTRTLLFVGR
jgi:hypothetical protein